MEKVGRAVTDSFDADQCDFGFFLRGNDGRQSDGMETAGTVSEPEKPSAPPEESKPDGEQPPESGPASGESRPRSAATTRTTRGARTNTA